MMMASHDAQRRRPARGLSLATLLGLLAAATAVHAQTASAPAAPPAAQAQPAPTTLSTVEVVATTPLVGPGLEADKVPAALTRLSAKDLSQAGAADLLGTLEQRAAAVSSNSVQANPFQPDFQYRGFLASPLVGSAQGLAVYQNGVRVNEAFGDVVNFDLIPDEAIADLDLLSNTPAFGLNALGGAVNLRMKDGFTHQGGTATAQAGSFGRIQGALEYGLQVGNVAAYAAGDYLHERGWREKSPSTLRRFYGDLGWRSQRGQVNLSLGLADNELTGNGPAPVQLVRVARDHVFTYPDRTENKLFSPSLRATYEVADAVTLQGAAYLRNYRRSTVNGDTFDAEACKLTDKNKDGVDDVTGDKITLRSGKLCLDNDGPILYDRKGQPISDFLNGSRGGVLNRSSTTSTSLGGSLQTTVERPIGEHKNLLVIGGALDYGVTRFNSSSELGPLTADRSVTGLGLIIDQPDGAVAPVSLRAVNLYGGLYLSDSFDVTENLTVTAGGRYNYAKIRLEDRLGDDLNGRHSFQRFNPAAGLTYRFGGGISAYAGYSESNRAPTAAELACADPSQPCTLTNFFIADPPLKQVVGRTYEAGLRGQGGKPFDGAKLNWRAGVFRTDLSNDLVTIAGSVNGTGYFANIGDTKRQGVELSTSLETRRWSVYLDYAYVDARYESDFLLSSPNHPLRDKSNDSVKIHSGDRMPSVPNHRLKLGGTVSPLSDWRVGASLTMMGNQTYRGDNGHLIPPIHGYAKLDLQSDYKVTDNVTLFALAQNVTNAKYETFGTFGAVSEVTMSEAPGAKDRRFVSPGAPRGLFAGLKVAF